MLDRHVGVLEKTDSFFQTGNCVERAVVEVDDITFVLPFQKLGAVHGVAVVKNDSRSVHFHGGYVPEIVLS